MYNEQLTGARRIKCGESEIAIIIAQTYSQTLVRDFWAPLRIIDSNEAGAQTSDYRPIMNFLQ